MHLEVYYYGGLVMRKSSYGKADFFFFASPFENISGFFAAFHLPVLQWHAYKQVNFKLHSLST